MLRKGQVQGVNKGDVQRQATLVARRFGIAIPDGKTAGFTAFRVKAHPDADAAPEVLAEIVEHATKWSPVANTLRNPVAVTATHV
jgi:organic hydroperoxide reductase OsmC/OhrA